MSADGGCGTVGPSNALQVEVGKIDRVMVGRVAIEGFFWLLVKR